MKIAFATLANLPCPPVKGGAIETLIDNICVKNEIEKNLDIDIYSIYDSEAEKASLKYTKTHFNYFKPKALKKLSFKNIMYKFFHISLPDKNMKKIVNAINKKEYDYVVFTTINRELKYIFKKIKSPVIWYLHGDPISVLDKKTLEDITAQCSKIITVSDFIKGRIDSVSKTSNIYTVLNCTDIVPINANEESEVRQNFRDLISVGPNETLITYVGRITPIKGILELINAFGKIKLKNIKLLIIGAPGNAQEENYYKQLKAVANENVIFYGYVNHSQLNKVYCASDIIAVPSTCFEAAQLTVLEALVCNRNVIATKIGGVPEYVFGKNYTLIDYNDDFIENLTAALNNGILNPSTSEFISADKYTVDNLYKSFCTALKE